MDSVQKEHERLSKRSKSSSTLDSTQAIIDALQNARDSIAAASTAAPVTLAKLHNPVKSSFETINASLKEIYGGHNKYTKVLDKLFKDKPLPSNEIDALSPHPALVNRAIYLHLLRQGLFDVATTLNEESAAISKVLGENTMQNTTDELKTAPLGIDETESTRMQEQFTSMYHILNELRVNHNLQPAILWAREHTKALEIRGSNLEFELCRLQYVKLFLSDDADVADGADFHIDGPQRALQYAREEFQAFSGRYLVELCQLAGAMAFCSNLEESPYRSIFDNETAWDEVAASFTREFCALMELSADSPLYIAATAGAIALPTLLKLQNIMQQKRTEWTTENELPVEIPLPPSYQFHSIFVCPVSKEQTTDQNPPMMMPCGHVIAHESLHRLSKGGKFKCPYCPGESHPRDAKKVFL
jgi:E3 ubiquitin-protein transferase RMND5